MTESTRVSSFSIKSRTQNHFARRDPDETMKHIKNLVFQYFTDSVLCCYFDNFPKKKTGEEKIGILRTHTSKFSIEERRSSFTYFRCSAAHVKELHNHSTHTREYVLLQPTRGSLNVSAIFLATFGKNIYQEETKGPYFLL